jgi:hypothetical protein
VSTKWTKTQPTEDGYYWYADYDINDPGLDNDPTVVHYASDMGKYPFTFLGDEDVFGPEEMTGWFWPEQVMPPKEEN